jgi:hypothetical protein
VHGAVTAVWAYVATRAQPYLTDLRACLLDHLRASAAQMVIAANGHHKVPFEDLLVAGSPGWQVEALPTLHTHQHKQACTRVRTTRRAGAAEIALFDTLHSAHTHPPACAAPGMPVLGGGVATCVTRRPSTPKHAALRLPRVSFP